MEALLIGVHCKKRYICIDTKQCLEEVEKWSIVYVFVYLSTSI